MKTKDIQSEQNTKAELLDLIFFFNKMTHSEVRVERDGFMLSYPEHHIHVDMGWIRLDDIKNIILGLHEYNLIHIEQETYESLKEKGIDHITWMCEGMKPNYKGKALTQKRNLDEYNGKIEEIRKSLN